MLLSQIVHRNAAMLPNHAALHDDDRSVTWRELQEEMTAVGTGLRKLGAETGDRVAVIVPNRVELVVTAFACFDTGLVFTPLNYHLTVPELGRLLEDCRPAVVVLDLNAFPKFLPVVEEFASRTGSRRVVVGAAEPGTAYTSLQATKPAPKSAAFSLGLDDQAPAVLIYTGGSTGRPKAVLLSHRNWVHSCRDELYCVGWREDDVMYQQLPMFHTSFVHFLTACLAGSSTVLSRRGGPGQFVAAVRNQGVTCTHMVISNLFDLVRHLEAEGGQLTTLRTLIYGGSPIPHPLIARAHAVLGRVLTQLYGQTEAGGAVTILRPEDHEPPAEGASNDPSFSVGRAMPTVTIRIDGAAGVGDSLEGEVLVHSDGVMLGYWGGDANHGVVATIVEPGRWLRTGDIGRLDEDGYLYIVDRIKDLIICGGENVSASEVEEVLIGFRGVREVAVIGVADDRLGEHVAAVVVPDDTGWDGREALEDYARSNLAGMKRPRSTFLIDALPKTPVGKIDKPALRKLYAHTGQQTGPKPGTAQ